MKTFKLLCLAGALFLAVPVSAQKAAAPTDGEKPAVVFYTLGTGGGPVIRKERGQPANALVVGEAIYLFDVGAGAQGKLAQAGLNPRNINAIFLSHHHIDHVADLGPMLISRWVLNSYDKLKILGPRGTKDMTAALIESARPISLAPVTIGGPAKPDLSSTVDIADLDPEMLKPTEIYRDENIRVLAVENNHFNYEADSLENCYSRSYAFRIETSDRSFVFTGDTGVSDRVVELAKGADLLVSEVIDMQAIEATLKRIGIYSLETLKGLLAHMEEDHLTPRQVGQLAHRAGVGGVVLTHFVPGNDGERDFSGYLDGLANEYSGKVFIAQDLDQF